MNRPDAATSVGMLSKRACVCAVRLSISIRVIPSLSSTNRRARACPSPCRVEINRPYTAASVGVLSKRVCVCAVSNRAYRWEGAPGWKRLSCVVQRNRPYAAASVGVLSKRARACAVSNRAYRGEEAYRWEKASQAHMQSPRWDTRRRPTGGRRPPGWKRSPGWKRVSCVSSDKNARGPLDERYGHNKTVTPVPRDACPGLENKCLLSPKTH